MPESRGRLVAAAGELLSLVYVIRQSENVDDFRDLEESVNRLFQGFRTSAADLGISDRDVDDATHALAAAIDEALLTSEWSKKSEFLENTLARRYCKNRFLGEYFFTLLTQLRQETTPRAEVLEVFYYCLASGFKGKYSNSPGELEEIMTRLARELGSEQAKTPQFAPNAYVQGRAERTSGLPWIPILIVSLALPFFLWLLFWNVLDNLVERVLGG